MENIIMPDLRDAKQAIWDFSDNIVYIYRDLYIKFTYSAYCCIYNFLLFFSFFLYFFFIFFHFLASARMRLAKRSSCPAISCSWAATHLASIVVLLISIAFCFNLSSFSCNSFSFFSISFFLFSISMVLGSYVLQFPPPGTAVKMINPPLTFLLIVNLSFPGLYDNEI